MKTHIINIQPDDKWPSVAARLPRAAGDRAVLLWPDKGGPQPLDAALRILLGQAGRRNVGLAVASQQRPVALAAKALGLPVFAEAQAAGRAEWFAGEHAASDAAELRDRANERRRLPQAPNLAIRLAWFALGVLAFLLAASLLLGLRV